MPYVSSKVAGGVLAFLLIASACAGCGLVSDPAPDTARVVVEGEAEAPVSLVVSTAFVAGNRSDGLGQQRLDVEVVDADTIAISTPFDQSYNIEREQRFLAQIIPRTDSTSVESVQLDGFIDERRRFSSIATEADSLLQFVYIYQGSAPPDDGQL
ncbi:MAG: hypothetical protein ACQETP_06620 [Bacteroidota bacterium]